MQKLVNNRDVDSHDDSHDDSHENDNSGVGGGNDGIGESQSSSLIHDNENSNEHGYELPTWQELTLILVSWSECGDVGDVEGFLEKTV
jgi:hypothetical protein